MVRECSCRPSGLPNDRGRSEDLQLRPLLSMFLVPCSRRCSTICTNACLPAGRLPRRRLVLKSHYCGELRREHAGQDVTLAGWVHRRRDHGGLIFLDLRDSEGIVQVVVNPQTAPAAHTAASDVRNEYVVQVRGRATARRPGTENASLPTGALEVAAAELRALTPSKTPPFYVNEETPVEELLRLRYRYLDLRRERMHANILLRARVTRFVREFLSDRGFVEVETPILANPTPEGARDYLGPRPVYPGHFFALPQSPQQFKQVLMVAGIEKYFQIARCFRDEDLRTDRQAEHTQIDLEWSFVERDDVLALMEEMYTALARRFLPDARLVTPFPRLTYAESMERFGTDKPDLRYGLEIGSIADLAAQSEHGAKGLVSFALMGTGSLETLTVEDVRSPVGRFFPVEQVRAIAQRVGAGRGDLMLFVAGPEKVVRASLDALRREAASRLGLAAANTLCFCFVTHFPLLAWAEEAGWGGPGA